ncbi:MAG: sugar phosphate isomerase/epimerase [Verrucomicrobiota bacterium]|nr:sugar phosphate isomerase/epimerase [Verrucomicrobiota bacterium]
MGKCSKEKIKIGTLVNCNQDSANYIKQIVSHGFESFSLVFWQTTGNLNWKKLADEVNLVLEESGTTISSLGMFGNPLENNEIDRETLRGWKECIENAHLFNTDIVAGFTGRIRNKPIPDSVPRLKEVFTPLLKKAQDKGLKIAFENCDMDGTWNLGDWNIAHSPSSWEIIFEALPFDNVGLEWEPCHQMVSLIDPIPQLKEWVDKIFHVHGKDASIHWDVIEKYGIHGPEKFTYHRTPGFGDSNWTDIISELRKANFEGSIDIEGWHDPVYCDELEMTGQVSALNYLKGCRGGSFIENPK